MQRDTCFALTVVIVVVLVGIIAIVLDFLSFKTYKHVADSLRVKHKGTINTPEDVINLVIAEAKKIGITPSNVVVGKNSAFVEFNKPGRTIVGPLEESKE